MQRRDFLRAAGAALAPPLGALGQRAPSFDAAVAVDPTRELGRVGPKVHGHQLEHLERVVYGGVFDPGSPRADALELPPASVNLLELAL